MKHSNHFARVLPAAALLTAFSCAASLSLLSAGCGGGNKDTAQPAASRKAGSVTMTIKWPRPDGTRKIPLAARSITLTITGAGGTQTQTVARPANGAPTPVTFSNLPIKTDYVLTATAFASTDGTGVALAKASTTVAFTLTDNNKSATLDLSTTIVRLGVTPNPITLTTTGPGGTAKINASGYDAASGGNMVPVASLSYVIADPTMATVATDPVSGITTLTARALGTTTLMVTDAETGLSVTVDVNVARAGVVVWSTVPPLDSPSHSGAAVSASGNVYVGGEFGSLYGLDPNGKPLPNFPVTVNATRQAVSRPAISSDGATGYVLDNAGNVLAFNTTSGVLTKQGTAAGYAEITGISSSRAIGSPVLVGDTTLYFGTLTGGIVKTTLGPPLTQTTLPVAGVDSVVNTPTVDTASGNIYATSFTLSGPQAQFHALKPDGTLSYLPVVLDGTVAVGTALGSGGKVVYAATALNAVGEVKVYGINTADGKIAWSKVLPSATLVSGAPVVGPDGTVYVGTWGVTTGNGVGGQVFALDSGSGAIKPGWPFQIPFVSGYLFSDVDSSVAVGPSGLIYVGSQNGNLYALNPDGFQQWLVPFPDRIYTTPTVGPDNTVYVGSEDGTFSAIR